MHKALNEFTGTVRRAVDDYNMIQEGDKIAVGVSGGKDSLVLLLAMNHLKRFYPKKFELEAITIELGYNKLALGHHFDDAVETYLMNLLFEGRIGCFMPVTFLDRSGVTQIRPMIYAGEQKISNLAEKLNVPIVTNPCPMDKASKRHEIKSLLKTLAADYPDMKSKVFGAMQRYPLPGWQPAENWRLKKEK